MGNLLKDYFDFSKTEKRGIAVLVVIVAIILSTPFVYKYVFLSKLDNNFIVFQQKIDALEASVESANENNTYKKYEKFDYYDVDKSFAEINLTPFTFDPNTATIEDFQKMGFAEKQIKTIENYRSKGGKYYKKEDFAKMYCINEEEYKILEPFISIQKKEYSKKDTYNEEFTIEINAATAEELTKIKGIGSSYSKRIVKYRELLGGYVNPLQLMEVYGMDSVRYNNMIPYVEINPYIVVKININTADFKILTSHPYISSNIALSIINYREMHGKYERLEEIKASVLIDNQMYNKISPYLVVE